MKFDRAKSWAWLGSKIERARAELASFELFSSPSCRSATSSYWSHLCWAAKPLALPLPRHYCRRTALLATAVPSPRSHRLCLASTASPCCLDTIATCCSSHYRVALDFHLSSTSPPEPPSSRCRLGVTSAVAWCSHSAAALDLSTNITLPSALVSTTALVTMLQPPSAATCTVAHGAATHAHTPHRPLFPRLPRLRRPPPRRAASASALV